MRRTGTAAAAPPLQRRRKAERPQEILQAALEVFSEKGFAGARLDDVAARAGITKGTIYVYFPSKEDLFVATLKEKTRLPFENLAALSADATIPAIEVVRSHLAFVTEHMIEDLSGREILRILLAEGHRFPEVVDRWYAEAFGPALESVASVVQRGIANGEFRPSALDEFPQLLLAPIVVYSSWYSLFGDRRPLDVRAFFDAAIDLLAGGLLMQPGLR